MHYHEVYCRLSTMDLDVLSGTCLVQYIHVWLFCQVHTHTHTHYCLVRSLLAIKPLVQVTVCRSSQESCLLSLLCLTTEKEERVQTCTAVPPQIGKLYAMLHIATCVCMGGDSLQPWACLRSLTPLSIHVYVCSVYTRVTHVILEPRPSTMDFTALQITKSRGLVGPGYEVNL